MASAAAQQVQKGALRRTATEAASATAIGWCDFFACCAASALVSSGIFFPNVDPLLDTLSAFAVLWVGFIFRLFGETVLGHFGDVTGRDKLLVTATPAVWLATALIGLLAPYAVTGIRAPLVLVTSRRLRGLAVGGQWGGAALLVSEGAPGSRRGFLGAFVRLLSVVAAILRERATSRVSREQPLGVSPTTLSAPREVGAWGRARW